METAIVLPIVLLVVIGIMEFGVLLYDQAMITNASREGARLGILFDVDGSGSYQPATDAEIQAAVDSYLTGNLVSFGSGSATTTVTPGYGTRQAGGTGTAVTVQVDYPYTFLVLPNWMTLGNNINLRAESVMRME